jgi:hypothetical protein
VLWGVRPGGFTGPPVRDFRFLETRVLRKVRKESRGIKLSLRAEVLSNIWVI